MEPATLLIVQLLTAAPFLVVHCRVCYVLFMRQRQFNQPFFKLLLLNNIAYLALWLLIHVGQHNYPLYASIFGAFQLPDTYVHWKGILRYLTNCAAFTTFICCLSLSLNRLSSILMPVRHQQIWRRFLPLTYLICVLVPLVAFLGQFFTEARHELNRNNIISFYYFDIRNEISSWVRNSKTTKFQNRDRFIVVIFEAVIVFSCFFVNISSTLIIYLMGKITRLTELGAFSSNFFAICMFDLVIHLFWLAFDLASYLNEFHGCDRLFFWFQIVYLFVDNYDFLLPACFLVLTNKAVRDAAWPKRWRKSRDKVWVLSPPPSGSTNSEVTLLNTIIKFCKTPFA